MKEGHFRRCIRSTFILHVIPYFVWLFHKGYKINVVHERQPCHRNYL